MIQAILVFNNHGKPRLTKFYSYYVSMSGKLKNFPLFSFHFANKSNKNIDQHEIISFQTEEEQQQIVRDTFQLVSKRDDNVCNFLESSFLDKNSPDCKLIYRHYA